MITAVISFCTNDWRYLERCIAGVQPFCQEILITVCDHFFDGTEENYALLEEAFKRFPHCRFIEFAFSQDKSYRPFTPLYPEHPDWRHEWHNTGRYLSYFYSSQDYLFFIDCDEIVDGVRFQEWLQQTQVTENALRFAMLWYFREACYEALSHEDLSLLVKKSALDPEMLWDEDERMGLFFRLGGRRGILGNDGKPMIRHYSGVRSREEFLKKCAAWGHHWERDWDKLIEHHFSEPFKGEDFVRHHAYHQVEPLFDPLSESIPQLDPISLDEHLKRLKRYPNVIMVNQTESFRTQLFHVCNDHQFLQQ